MDRTEYIFKTSLFLKSSLLTLETIKVWLKIWDTIWDGEEDLKMWEKLRLCGHGIKMFKNQISSNFFLSLYRRSETFCQLRFQI